MGIKPTLHETNLTMETYILDYDGDLYGERIPVSLLRFLRPEQRFPSVQEGGWTCPPHPATAPGAGR